MKQEKIKLLVSSYATELLEKGIVAKRINTNNTFGSCSEEELLAHAAYLCDEAFAFILNPDKYGKANRHLTAIQMCLSFANMYTLDDLMNQNRPD